MSSPLLRRCLALLLVPIVLGAVPAAAELRLVRVMPARVHAEPDPRGWRLNFDLLLENTRSQPVTLDFVEIEAFDADGRLVLRRHMGGGGEPAAVAMLPRRVVPPLGRLQLFNPFPRLPADLTFASLRIGIYHSAGRLQVPIEPVTEVPFVLPVLPMGGDVFVESGSDLYAPHRRRSVVTPDEPALNLRRNPQRFAVDLTRLDDTGSYRDGDRVEPGNWFAWGSEVRTPVEGVVVAARGDVPDNVLLADGGVQVPDTEADPPGSESGPLGNHVIVELAPEVFLVLAHLQQGSVQVEVGDRLWAGALLGRVGMSGESTYPHLHLHLQRGADLLDSRPLPLVFACVDDAGGDKRRPAWLATGDRVGPCRIEGGRVTR